MVSAILIF